MFLDCFVLISLFVIKSVFKRKDRAAYKLLNALERVITKAPQFIEHEFNTGIALAMIAVLWWL